MVPPVVLCLMGLLATGRALRCYKCDNSVSRSCGEDFQAYQFEALECDQSLPHKCGKQIQEPIHDGWVGIIRGCYHLGSLPGVNETNGCHTWHHPHHNFTAVYCFCDLDFCNAATPAAPLLFPRLLWALALLTTFFLCASPYSSSSSSSSFLSTTTTSTSTLPRSLSSSSSRLPASSPESPHDSQQSATGLREMMTVESRPAPHQTRLRKVEKQKERRGGEEEEEEEEDFSSAKDEESPAKKDPKRFRRTAGEEEEEGTPRRNKRRRVVVREAASPHRK